MNFEVFNLPHFSPLFPIPKWQIPACLGLAPPIYPLTALMNSLLALNQGRCESHSPDLTPLAIAQPQFAVTSPHTAPIKPLLAITQPQFIPTSPHKAL